MKELLDLMLEAAAAGAAATDGHMSGSDHAMLEKAIWLCGLSDDFYQQRAGALALAAELVDEQRETIERVAAVLAARGRLCGDEFRKIVEAGNE